MPRDPLKIIGKPDPTPEERAAAEALSQQTGRPAKLCRAALLEANHDVAKATALLNDGKFLMWNAETDDVDMMELAQRLMRQQGTAPPLEDPFKGVDFEALAKLSEAYLKANPTREPHEKRVQEASGRTLDDPVFGPLIWNGMWEGQVDVPAFGRLQLFVDADREFEVATPPGAEHHEAFRKFVAAAIKLRPRIEKANFKYFRRVRKIYEEDDGDVPDVKNAADLWKELSDATLHVPLQDGKSWRVEIDWNCSWDEEHGHAVYIEGGKVVNVSIQGQGYEPD